MDLLTHRYYEWRNDAKNGVKSPNVVDFVTNTHLVEKLLEEIDEQNQSHIVNELTAIDTTDAPVIIKSVYIYRYVFDDGVLGAET